MLNDLGVFTKADDSGNHGTAEAGTFYIVWPAIVVEISVRSLPSVLSTLYMNIWPEQAMYPTIIIIFVSKLMSQEYAISSFQMHDGHAP